MQDGKPALPVPIGPVRYLIFMPDEDDYVQTYGVLCVKKEANNMSKRLKFFVTSIICICFLILIIPTKVEAASPKLSKKKITMTVGTQKQLTVKNTKKTIKWQSSSKKIAKVSKKGLVTAKKEGKATITATIGKKKLSCKATVKENPQMEKEIYTYVGKKIKLEVTGTTKKIQWKSANPKIAKVSPKGIVTGKRAGLTTVKATIGEKILKCRVNVSSESIIVSKRNDALIAKEETHEIGMGDYINIMHHEGSVSCWIADSSIAKIHFVEEEKAGKNKLGKSVIYIYSLKSGTTVIYVKNTKTGLIREVPIQVREIELNGKQTLARWLVNNGEFDEEGGMGIYEIKEIDGKTYLTEIIFSAVSYEVHFGYVEVKSEEVKVWTMSGHLHEAAVPTMMVDILVPDIYDPDLYHHVQRTIDGADCNLDHILFWYPGYPNHSEWDSMQDTYRTFNKIALKTVEELMIERTGFDWNALGQPCFVQEQSE